MGAIHYGTNLGWLSDILANTRYNTARAENYSELKRNWLNLPINIQVKNVVSTHNLSWIIRYAINVYGCDPGIVGALRNK